eukprot:scaffold157058_cov16-Tisochrysis_lutea.AAC.3
MPLSAFSRVGLQEHAFHSPRVDGVPIAAVHRVGEPFEPPHVMNTGTDACVHASSSCIPPASTPMPPHLQKCITPSSLPFYCLANKHNIKGLVYTNPGHTWTWLTACLKQQVVAKKLRCEPAQQVQIAMFMSCNMNQYEQQISIPEKKGGPPANQLPGGKIAMMNQ